MFTILLSIIYISFISLGLPDALLGATWPVMYEELQVPMGYAGILSMTIAGGTIISSLLSDRLVKKLGAGVITTLSVCMTAMALWGFSTAHHFIILCLWAIPYGLGAGAVDAALNNFVALHYKAKHMSWLHCFWGIGATLGPYIMGFCLTSGMRWHSGYSIVFIIQIVLTGLLIFSLPVWKKVNGTIKEQEETPSLTMKEVIQIPGARQALIAFFAYGALESVTGLWGSSYMVMERGMSVEVAAKGISLFYLGITMGRFLSGFITMKLSDEKMVRLGQCIALIGIGLLIIFQGNKILYLAFILIGTGCAPIYPSLIHATPNHFGKDLSQAIIGMQMACAYTGSTFVPPLVGFMAEHLSMKLYLVCLLIIGGLMLVMTEYLNKIHLKN